MSRTMKVLSGVGVVIIAAVVLGLYFTASLTKVIDLQLDAIRKGDIQLAYTYTSKEFQRATPYDGFVKFLDAYPALKNNKEISFGERSMSNDTGKVTATLTANDGSVTPIQYSLVKENGEWKILGFVLTQAPSN